jgi:hypothetical protein
MTKNNIQSDMEYNDIGGKLLNLPEHINSFRRLLRSNDTVRIRCRMKRIYGENTDSHVD